MPLREGPLEAGLPPYIWRPIASGFSAAITVLAITWALGLPGYLGIGLYPQQSSR